MDELIRLDEDWHVSSIFSSGGTASVEETVYAAEACGLKKLCLVEKVRRSSSWVPDFVGVCRSVDRKSPVEIHAGLEAEVLDTRGTLDLPRSAGLADHVFVAAQRLPTPMGPMLPSEARERIATGTLLPARAIEWLVHASASAALREGPVVLADPFRILPELGIGARNVHPAYIRWLAGALVEREACVEISERWRGPSSSVLRCLLRAGVTVRASSGSDSPEGVGRYAWCREIAAELEGCVPEPARESLYVF